MTFFVIIRGPLGCGKTTVAKRLSKNINAKYFSVDQVLEEKNLDKDWEQGYISQKSFKKANEIMVELTKKILERGNPVVFDGNFYWKSQIKDLINRLDFKNYIFTLNAPLKVCINRDKKRDKTYGEKAVREVYKKSTEFDYGIKIDVTRPVKECIDEILNYLPGN